MRSLGSWGRYTLAVRREKGLLGANGLPLRANCLVRPDATKSPPLALLSHLPPSSEAVISVYAPLLSAHPFFLIFLYGVHYEPDGGAVRPWVQSRCRGGVVTMVRGERRTTSRRQH